jgi:FkbM family methyltransferase
MNLLDYIRRKLSRRKARRVFNEYPTEIHSFQLSSLRKVDFANWKNPLIEPKTVTDEMVNFFKKFIPKGSMAIDIGAHIGDTTVPMALAAGKEGVTLGFDPNPHIFKILTENAALNRDKTNIIPLQYAITEAEGDFYYASSEASFSNGGISAQPSKFHGNYSLNQKIKGVNLEKFLLANYPEWLTKISFIKIDAEGHDKAILRSIHGLIEKYKPVVVSECFTKNTPQEREELFDSIATKGYDLYYFEDFDENTEVIPLSKKDMMRWKNFNFYAISREQKIRI